MSFGYSVLGFGAHPQTPSGPVTLVYDTFTDADSTALTAHTPDIDVVGGGWSSSAGALKILSNKAKWGTASNSHETSEIQTNKSDVVISVDVNSTAQFLGILGRYVDDNNFWLAWMSKNTMRIYERTTGTDTERAYQGAAAAFPYTAVFTFSGTSIELTNGTQTISYTSA